MEKEQIPGELMRPCFMSEEEFEEGYKSSIFWTDKSFYKAYRDHLVGMGHVAECAKIFILNNYQKVKDWSNLDVIVINGSSRKSTEYYNNEKILDEPIILKKESEISKKLKKITKPAKKSDVLVRMRKKWDKQDKLRHNPIKTLSDVILDPTDGDFSLTINGEEHWWIQDEAVIIIANYIENQIKLNYNE